MDINDISFFLFMNFGYFCFSIFFDFFLRCEGKLSPESRFGKKGRSTAANAESTLKKPKLQKGPFCLVTVSAQAG